MVFFSIVVLFMEAEERHGDSGATFWQWNERILLIWFLLEYLIRWATAANRWRYPLTVLGVIDLLAILPVLVGLGTGFRSLKMIRAFLMLRLLKLYRYNRALQNVMHGFRRVAPELAVVGFVAVIVLLTSSLAMFEFEHDAQPQVFTHMWDALWWSLATLTTVGYGDVVPVTVGGRLVAMTTMVIGIGIFGTFISLVGSSFLTTMREEEKAAKEGRVPREPEEEPLTIVPAQYEADPPIGDMPG